MILLICYNHPSPVKNVRLDFFSCQGGGLAYTDNTGKDNFFHIVGNLEGSGAKSYVTNDLLIFGENS
jgi:hypothetical protein